MPEKQFSMIVEGVKIEGDSMQELQDNAAQALAEYRAQVEQAQPPQTVDRSDYFGQFYADPMAAHDTWYKERFGETPQQTKQRRQAESAIAWQTYVQQVNAAVVQENQWLMDVAPEDDLKNSNAVAKIVQEQGWEYNVNNVKAALALARERGQIVMPLPKSAQSATAQQVTYGGPALKQWTMPTFTASGADNKEYEAEFLKKAPTEAVGEYLTRKAAAKQAR